MWSAGRLPFWRHQHPLGRSLLLTFRPKKCTRACRNSLRVILHHSPSPCFFPSSPTRPSPLAPVRALLVRAVVSIKCPASSQECGLRRTGVAPTLTSIAEGDTEQVESLHCHPLYIQRSAKRHGCLLSYSEAEPGRELTQLRKHL